MYYIFIIEAPFLIFVIIIIVFQFSFTQFIWEIANYNSTCYFSLRWTFNPAVLTKVATPTNSAGFNETPQQQFAVGDVVQICPDMERVKMLQKGHGDWADGMAAVSITIYKSG